MTFFLFFFIHMVDVVKLMQEIDTDRLDLLVVVILGVHLVHQALVHSHTGKEAKCQMQEERI